MNLVSLIDYLRDRMRLVIGVGVGILALLLVIDLVRALTSGEHETAPISHASEHGAIAGEHSAATSSEHAAHAAKDAAAHPAHAAGEPSEAAHAAKEGFWQSLYHIAETWPTFWAFFGFIACVLIVFVSKKYGHLTVGNTEIMTREDYYNE